MAEITKSMAQKLLGDVPVDKPFWSQDGRTLKNLQELAAALKEMSDETFRYHLNEAKNDFSNWVRDVVGDEKLAGDLWNSFTRTQAALIVADRIAYLKRRARSR